MDHKTIFVYGTLKQGFSNHGLMQDSQYVASARTVERYPMVNINGIFPYMYEQPGEGFRVLGEVYEVTTNTMERLDWLEGVPEHYYRELIDVDADGVQMQAWCYFSKIIHNSDSEFLEVYEA